MVLPKAKALIPASETSIIMPVSIFYQTWYTIDPTSIIKSAKCSFVTFCCLASIFWLSATNIILVCLCCVSRWSFIDLSSLLFTKCISGYWDFKLHGSISISLPIEKITLDNAYSKTIWYLSVSTLSLSTFHLLVSI